jgi:hypothetical protein
MSDFDSLAEATAAGFAEIVSQKAGEFLVTLEKHLVGAPGVSGGMLRAYGHASTKAEAESLALQSLNEQRRHRYAGESSIPGPTRTVPADYPEVGTKTLDSFQTYYGSPPTAGTTLTPDVS